MPNKQTKLNLPISSEGFNVPEEIRAWIPGPDSKKFALNVPLTVLDKKQLKKLCSEFQDKVLSMAEPLDPVTPEIDTSRNNAIYVDVDWEQKTIKRAYSLEQGNKLESDKYHELVYIPLYGTGLDVR